MDGQKLCIKKVKWTSNGGATPHPPYGPGSTKVGVWKPAKWLLALLAGYMDCICTMVAKYIPAD